jgi:muramoyltetrapeptide carboxypeptidase
MIIPPKLKKGDTIRIIAPSMNLTLLSKENILFAKKRLEKEGFKITFSKNCNKSDTFLSSPIKSRIYDLHEAFKDKKIKAIFPVFGGFNSNQLLDYIDYELIKNNPKIIIGYSDITALINAITKKTKLITYSGLLFSTWAMKKQFDYNLNYFKKCLMFKNEFEIKESEEWSDDKWYEDQKNRIVEKNKGYKIINKGKAQGIIYGGNLCTLNLLQGTKYMPNISNSILFIEEDDFAGKYFAQEFERNLQSLIQQPNFKKVKGIVFGRFQKKSEMDNNKLTQIIKTKKELKKIPIISNADFGHTNPMFTFPIGGIAEINTNKEKKIKIIIH